MTVSRVSLLVSTLALAATACGDIGDENYLPPPREAVNQVDLDNRPWCVGTCLPDYGSQRIDCNAEAGVEFFPVDVLNAETGTVAEFYAYNDDTNDFMVAGPAGYDPDITPVNFAPPAVPVNDRCGPDGTLGMENVHHIRGGLFREWGGGIGRRLLNFTTTATPPCPAGPSAETDPDYCVDADPRVEAAGDPALSTNFYEMMADLRGWEGISFWARGGPNNTAGMRVGLGDRQLDDDIAFLEYRAGLEPLCGRVRECGCRNHRPCTLNDTMGGLAFPTYSCWQPGLDLSPAQIEARVLADGGRPIDFLNDWPYESCQSTFCNLGNAAYAAGDLATGAPDPLFATADHPGGFPGTAQCLPYKLTNDLEANFCYDPTDPKRAPADPPDRCGDVWARGVTLTTDWQFYKIPFTELRQEGYAKQFGALDLSKLTLVRFTWSQGWVDIWLDDVRFYRHQGFTGQPQ